MTDLASIARIQPARWFKHALSAGQLVDLLEARLRTLECAKDARAVFCSVRLAQFRHIHGLMETDAFGAGGAWIERLEIEHVHQYLRAADSWDRSDLALTAAPWRLIFAREHQGGTSAGESLRVGAIAHLAYDLPLALARIGSTSLPGGEVERSYAQLTQIYAATTEEAVRGALTRYARPSRLRFGQNQSAITGAWQRELRAQAWDDAADLIDADDDGLHVTFTRIELAAMCEIRRATNAAQGD